MKRAPLFAVVAFFAVVAACTPGERDAARPYLEPGAKLGCILLRAVTMSGSVDEICATVDELAPYVADLLARRELEPETRDVSQASTLVAFVAPAPARRVPRRRCVAWVPVASLRDAGSEGGRDASE